ncbi:MAG: hypothetical protein JWN70_5794 [Planctomycetaceae bacterium]|nr:hypothetical protein [Planctomycetaceae bacterium]
MASGLWKKSTPEPPPELGDDATATELLDCVVQEILDGKARTEIARELVRHRWERQAANQFTLLAQQIARELLLTPPQRGACARRGAERMQAAYGWIGSGLVMGIFLTVMGPGLRRYNRWCLLPVAYGVVELISGYTLWHPHREFWTANDVAKAKSDLAAKK